MEALLYIILATFIVSLIAFIGALSLSLKPKMLKKIVLFLVALSAGALMGGAFLHLIPEAVAEFQCECTYLYVLIGFVLFFVIEKFLHWRHCHDVKCKIHTFAYMNLIGDAVHNFVDGLIIAASFVANTGLGVITTIAIIFHEVPQEIGDFGVLIYGGFSRGRALLWNFIVAVTAIIGGIAGYYLSSYIGSAIPFLLPFAAGGFIYIAATDLVPEIRKEMAVGKYSISLLTFILGILIMYSLRFIGG